jgi:hypothetical protein
MCLACFEKKNEEKKDNLPTARITREGFQVIERKNGGEAINVTVIIAS